MIDDTPPPWLDNEEPPLEAHPPGELANGADKRVVRAKPEVSWSQELVYTERGQVKSAAANVVAILTNDSRWRGVLAWNEHSYQVDWLKPPPWTGADKPKAARGTWTERDDRLMLYALEREWGISLHLSQIRGAVETVSQRSSYHPIRQHLERLQWDEIARLDNWLVRYCGAEDSPYVREIGRWTLIGAVARAMEPGCKMDTVLILEGEQGARKSTVVEILGGEWGIEESAANLSSTQKDLLLNLRLAWIVEAAEFDAVSGRDFQVLKANISRRVDTYRAPYGADSRKCPRGCIVIGTTNADAYLRDATGGRRFLPTRTGRIDADALRRDRDQLWAEAVHRYRRGARWHATDLEAQDRARAEQEARRLCDSWEPIIEHWLAGKRLDPDGVTVGEILEFAVRMTPGQWSKAHEMRVADCLKVLGWAKRGDYRRPGTRTRPYFPASPNLPNQQLEVG